MILIIGSAERKFYNIQKKNAFLKYILCWFHTLNQCFIPRIKKLKNKSLIDNVIQGLRNIYSSKTKAQRDDAVCTLNELIEGETAFELYISSYLKLEYLNLWSSLYKISQYAEHSSNYLERLFKEVNAILSFNFHLVKR